MQAIEVAVSPPPQISSTPGEYVSFQSGPPQITIEKASLYLEASTRASFAATKRGKSMSACQEIYRLLSWASKMLKLPFDHASESKLNWKTSKKLSALCRRKDD